MILNDIQIRELAELVGMIEPFEAGQVKKDGERRVISYGLSSYGYDIRVGNEFMIFTNAHCSTIDPKNFDESNFVRLHRDDYVLIPPNSFALCHSYEVVTMPRDVVAVCIGKSTYARCGLVVNVTPIEPGWRGHITIEISNTTPNPARVYANEGIAQLLFYQGEQCEVTYSDRNGKYMDQANQVTLPRV